MRAPPSKGSASGCIRRDDPAPLDIRRSLCTIPFSAMVTAFRLLPLSSGSLLPYTGSWHTAWRPGCAGSVHFPIPALHPSAPIQTADTLSVTDMWHSEVQHRSRISPAVPPPACHSSHMLHCKDYEAHPSACGFPRNRCAAFFNHQP